MTLLNASQHVQRQTVPVALLPTTTNVKSAMKDSILTGIPAKLVQQLIVRSALPVNAWTVSRDMMLTPEKIFAIRLHAHRISCSMATNAFVLLEPTGKLINASIVLKAIVLNAAHYNAKNAFKVTLLIQVNVQNADQIA